MKKTLYTSICALFIMAICATKGNSQTIASHFMNGNCYTPVDSIQVMVSGYTGIETVTTYYGDGTSDTHPAAWSSGTTAWYDYSHYYGASGTYTVKFVLTSGGVDVDSVITTFTYTLCQSMFVTLYHDVNSDCAFNTGDLAMPHATTVEIDSAGIPVDTITSSWYINYIAYGPVGTIYTFRVIAAPYGLLATCPTGGVVYDTVSFGPPTPPMIGFTCDPTAAVDNAIHGNFRAAVPGAKSYTYVTSTSCTPISLTLTITHSPKYTLSSITGGGGSYTTSGNVITYTIPSIDVANPVTIYGYYNAVGVLVMGDTAQTSMVLNPTGDFDPTNNVIIEVDTIRSSYDPNEKSVTPAGDITAGTTLEYMLQFENCGNDTAHNIHLLDTLSDNLDINSIKQLASSHKVTMHLFKWGTRNVVKFDFPNIKLLDTSYHGLSQGFVTFSIKTITPLAPGSTIENQVGIYFDINPVVMTNKVVSMIGFPMGIATTNAVKVQLYPNPVKDVLSVKAEGTNNTMTITNTLGQVIATQTLNSNINNVNVKSLPSGLYYMTIKGDNGVQVQKFEKM